MLTPIAGLYLTSSAEPNPLSSTLASRPCLIDGDIYSECAEPAVSGVCGIDFGTPTEVMTLIVRLYGDYVFTPEYWTANQGTFNVYTSNDNSTWTLAQSFVTPSLQSAAPLTNGHVVLTFTLPQTARYFKVRPPGTSVWRDDKGSPTNWLGCTEIEAYGTIYETVQEDASSTFETDADIRGWRFISEGVSVDDAFLDNIAEFEEGASASFSLADNLADWLTGATANIQLTVNGIFNTDLYEESTVRSALLGTGFYALTIDDGFDGADASDRCLRYSMSIAEAMDSADSDEGKVQKIGYIYDGTMIWDAVPLGWLKTVPDTFALADAPSTPLCLIIPDVLTLIDQQFNLWDGVHTIEETAVILDSSVYAQYLKSIADTMGLADLPRLLLTMPISDWLTLSDSVPLLIKAAILESMLLSDTSFWGWDKTIADTFATADAPSALATFNRAIADTFALAGAASFLKTCGVSVPDTMALTDVSASAVKLYNIILESLSLNVLLDVEGELWECFVLNTPRFHASMYSGYNFNSFCVFNGRAFGANDTGIFELTGSTDAGDTIHTGVVLKGTDFGTPNQKRMRRGYFGVSGSSPVLILETESGQRQVYSIDTKGKTVASHELKSKSWTLSIADFDALDSVKLIPVILSK